MKYRYFYDEPQTPLERLRKADPDNPELGRLEKVLAQTNGIALRGMIAWSVALRSFGVLFN